MDSIWSETSKNEDFPQLKGDLKTDVVIVGGGLAGVLCLKELTDRGVDCVLLEAKSIGSGSHRTGKKSVGYKASEDFCKKNFPDARIEHRFAIQ